MRPGTKWTRIGNLVIFTVQITIPNATNGAVLATFSNIPTPLKDENFFTVSNSNNHRGLSLSNDKTLRANGDISLAGWLGGTCIYATNEFI